MSSETFTAAEIEQAARRSKRSVLDVLKSIPSVHAKIVSGNAAQAWNFDQLPQRLKERLEQEKVKRGCRSVEAVLSARSKAWLPSVPLSQCAPAAVDRASALQRALAPTWNRLHDLNLSETEFERLGVDDYRRSFGHPISTRHWRRLFRRTLDRDACAENWGRLEIYLAESPPRKCDGTRGLRSSQVAFRQLHDVIAAFKNAATPSNEEKDYLWTYAFEHHERDLESGKKPKVAKGEILNFLHQHACFLARSRKGIKLQFNRKFDLWISDDRRPSAIQDRRKFNVGRPSPKLSKASENAIIAKTLQSGGGLSQAWRACRDDGVLDASIAEHYRRDPRDKSYVPARIRKQLSPQIAMLDDPHHGPRATKLNGAFINRDPNTFHAGDWWQADDTTLPAYWYTEDPDGPHLMRGQCLAMVDVRTTFIMGFVLIPQPNYTAHHIRNLTTIVADTYGLPRKGFYYEKGIWKTAALLHGRKDQVHWHQTEMGLRGLGLQFKHAKLPRGKVIERVLGLLQNYIESEPGYCGRDERADKFERVQQHKRLVENGKAHPSEFFLSEADWFDRLNVIVDKYNDERQQGKHCPDLSPREAFQTFYGSEPCTRLHPCSRYLLASHKMRVRSGRNGISFRFGRKRFTYKSRETGELRGQDAIAWFNVEDPSTLSVTNLKEEPSSLFTVEREISVPAMDATTEVLSAALAQNEAHDSYRRALYRTVSQNFCTGFAGRMFRGNLVDRKTFEAGTAMRDQERRLKERRVDQRKRAAAIDRKAGRLGIAPGIMSSRPDAEEGLDLMAEAMANLGLLSEANGSAKGER